MSVPVTGTLVAFSGGLFPVTDAVHQVDGWRSVADHATRDGIYAATPLLCRQGMAVCTQNDGLVWVLNTATPGGTSADWTQLAGSGGTPGGSSGQIQYDNAGSFGGFTMSGDATLVASTGVITIAAGAVTLAKHANLTASSLMGNPTGSAAAPSAVILGTNLSFSGTTLNALGGGAPIPPKVVYASSANIILDGATDQATQIQAILDAYGTAGYPLRFILDGMAAVKATISPWSGQWIDAIPGLGGFFKIGYSGGAVGTPVIQNKHPVLGTVTVGGTDKNIRLSNLYIDGNRRGGSNGVSGGGTTPWMNPSYYLCPAINMAGVTNLTIDNTYVYDSAWAGYAMRKVVHGYLSGISHFKYASDTLVGNDNIDILGWCNDIKVIGMSTTGNDDPWAICSSAPATPTAGRPAVPYNAAGPIADILIQGSSTYGTSGGRLLATHPANYIANVTIRDSRVRAASASLWIDNWGLSAEGTGAYDNIVLENLLLETNFSGAAIAIGQGGGAVLNNLIIDKLQVIPLVTSSTVASAIRVDSDASFQSLRINGLELEDSTGLSTVPVVTLAGTIPQVSFQDCRVDRGTTQLAQPFLSATGTVGDVQFVTGYYDHINNVVNVSAGTTTIVQSGQVSHTNANSNATFAQSSSGTFTTLKSGQTNTALLASGTITNNSGNT